MHLIVHVATIRDRIATSEKGPIDAHYQLLKLIGYVETMQNSPALSLFTPLQNDTGPIDVVYTWVDDQDPAWQKSKNEAYLRYTLPSTSEANARHRFRNREELKYSLRSVHTHAPFVNHIFIVTAGQKPSWIQPHEKITFIDHSQIFVHKEHLPTFNSVAIEANLHHIPNLQERFIYFNDDILLGKNVEPTDFFTEGGKIKVCYDPIPSPHGPVLQHDNSYDAAWKNTNAFLDILFGQEPRNKLAHVPFALRKSHLQQFETHFSYIINLLSSHKFRSQEDFVITCGLIQHFARYQQQADDGALTRYFFSMTTDLVNNHLSLLILYRDKRQALCIDDIFEADSMTADQQLHQFFEAYYPTPAPWE